MTPIDRLSRLRTLSARESPEVVKLGKEVLASGVKLGEQEWPVREQITMAALDVGDIQLAESQITILSRRFPSSPRLLILQALHLESLGKYTSARIIYHCLLGKREGVEVPRGVGGGEKEQLEGVGIGRGEGTDDGSEGVRVMALWKGEPDECFVTAHQRLITLALYPPPSSTTSSSTTTTTPTQQGINQAIPLLTHYLHIFHSDPDAWSLLADLYVVSTPGLASPPTTTHTGTDPGTGARGWGIDALFADGTIHLRTLHNALPGTSSSSSLAPTSTDSYIPQAQTSLAQQILLEPWTPRPLARFAELSLLSGDIETGYGTLLRCVEMMSEPFAGGNDPSAGDGDLQKVYAALGGAGVGDDGWREVMRVGGWKTRVWWDLALCTTILTHPSYRPSPSSASTSSSPLKQVQAVRKLVVRRLEALYGASGVVERWERGLMSG